MLLMEEFKNCFPSDVKTYLDEKKAINLSQAATFTDDYVLTHKHIHVLTCLLQVKVLTTLHLATCASVMTQVI